MTKHSHRLWRMLLVCALALSSVIAYAQSKGKPSGDKSGADIPRVNFKEVKLKNGLRVFLVEDHSAPVISLALIYDVGSRNERQGRTGFAHIFEHTMFQGSADVGKSNQFNFLAD